MRCKSIAALLGSVGVILAAASASAATPDVSDSAIGQLLAGSFQYDYTAIVDDPSLRAFITALDRRLAAIEYRQRKELTVLPGSAGFAKSFRSDLEQRYRELVGDRFIFEKLNQWQKTTGDPVNKAFIDLYLDKRSDLMADPAVIREARQLAQRISDRLYSFGFIIDGNKYGIKDAARIIFAEANLPLARKLYRMVNDSAALLADDAAKLYVMYSKMGELRGYRTSLDYALSRLSFRKPEWLIIADNLKQVTEAEYVACLADVKKEAGRDDLALFEIEKRLVDAATLPDVYFTPEKVDSAIRQLLRGFGFGDLLDRLDIRVVDSGSYSALAIRLFPPDENLLITNRQGGYGYYTRLAAELGRSLPWVYADSALPYVLRDYPIGSEEMLTALFETLAIDSAFLATHFDIPAEALAKYSKKYRQLTTFRLRQTLLFFYFDYYLSEEKAANPGKLFMALEDSLFKVQDSSYQWIEILITGGLQSAPLKLAHRFCCAKTIEMLSRRFGDNFAADPSAGRFLIDKFCMPGRRQTIEQYITANAESRLGMTGIRRQLNLR